MDKVSKVTGFNFQHENFRGKRGADGNRYHATQYDEQGRVKKGSIAAPGWSERLDLNGDQTKSVRRAEVRGAHAQSQHHRAGAHVVGAAAKAEDGHAQATASLASASANVTSGKVVDLGIVGIEFGAGAHAEAGAACAQAKAKDYGASASAHATVARAGANASTGIGAVDKNLKVSASLPSAGGRAEANLKTLTAQAAVGAHLAEAEAGPFAVRVGVKFGGGVQGGVPYVDMGPVTTPCSIM